MTEFYYVDALCGAGKTYGAIRYAINQAAKGGIIFIAQPSTKLIDQTQRDLFTLLKGLPGKRVTVHRFDGTTHEGCVFSALAKFNAADLGPNQVVLITHATLIGLPYWKLPSGVELLVDEIPAVDRHIQHKLPVHGEMLRTTIDAVDDDRSLDYLKLVAADKEALRRFQKRDDVSAVFRDIAHWLLNPTKFDTFVNADQWRRGKDGKFDLFAVIKPELLASFSKVTFLGAHFADSLLCQIWSQMGVEIRGNELITSRLFFSKHPLGNRKLTVHYLTERDWSKQLREKVGLPALKAAVQSIFSGTDYLWAANNDAEDKLDLPGRWIGNASHGANEFMGYNKAVFLSALNMTPGHIAFLERRYDVAGDELRKARMNETIYQAVMRCSARDRNATSDIEILVCDRNAADFIASQFDGKIYVRDAGVGFDLEPGKPGRPRQVVATDCATRNRTRRQREAEFKTWLDHRQHQYVTGSKTPKEEGNLLRSSYCSSSITASFFVTKKSAHPTQLDFANWDQLIALLRESSALEFATKEENYLISPAAFVAKPGVTTTRGRENISQVWGLWLDIDDGHLQPADIEQALPDCRVITCNSWSGGARFRCLIPTDLPMSADMYEAIWDTVTERIANSAGMTNNSKSKKLNFTGFDRSKRTPGSMFYLPSQAQNASESFFTDRPGNPLDVTAMIPRLNFHRETAEADRHRNPHSNGMAKLQSTLLRSDKGARVDTTMTLGNCDVVPPKVLDAYLALTEGRYAGLHKFGMAVARHCKSRGIPLGLSDLTQLYVEAHRKNPCPSRKGNGRTEFEREARNAIKTSAKRN